MKTSYYDINTSSYTSLLDEDEGFSPDGTRYVSCLGAPGTYIDVEGTPDVAPAAEEEPFVEEERDLTPLPPLLEGMSETEVARFMG